MNHDKGFSLLELVIVLMVLAILLITAVPSFYTLIASNRSDAVVSQLASVLNFARIEAISRGQITHVCASKDGQQCSSNWSDGLKLFTHETIRRWQLSGANGQLRWRGFPASKSQISFTPEGFTQHQNGTFYYCPASGDPQFSRQVVLSKTGRVRIIKEGGC